MPYIKLGDDNKLKIFRKWILFCIEHKYVLKGGEFD